MLRKYGVWVNFYGLNSDMVCIDIRQAVAVRPGASLELTHSVYHFEEKNIVISAKSTRVLIQQTCPSFGQRWVRYRFHFIGTSLDQWVQQVVVIKYIVDDLRVEVIQYLLTTYILTTRTLTTEVLTSYMLTTSVLMVTPVAMMNVC